MKLCYDFLDDVVLTKNGNFVKYGVKYPMYLVYRESCSYCGEPYLTKKRKIISEFCSNSCANSGENNCNYGKKYSKAEKELIAKGNRGAKNIHWKGGLIKDNLPSYDTYSGRLTLEEAPILFVDNLDRRILKVKCFKCGNYFIPSIKAVKSRIGALAGRLYGECHLYCSDKCKNNCEVYNKKPQHFFNIKDKNKKVYYTTYDLQVWSKEVLKRANYKCEYCGKPAEHAHHIKPKKLEPGFALDPDNGLACCKNCHYKYGHRDECNINNIIIEEC